MTVLDPALCARLIAEAREDDGRMTSVPWHGDEVSGIVFGDGNHDDGSIELARMQGEALIGDAEAIARARNNLRSLADQLEAALAEAARIPDLQAAIGYEIQKRDDLALRLQVATETNVADRKRMRALEDGLREACDNLDPEWEVTARLRKLVGG